MSEFYAVKLYGLSMNFWQLTLNVASELINCGNPSSMSYEGWGWPSEEEYEEYMKWSDKNIAEPTLFNFYHGMELSLKALLHAKGSASKNNHKLSSLLNMFMSLYENRELANFYQKYINKDKLPSILKNFCNESNVTMDLYFQSLKYPASTKGVNFNHSSLRAHNKDGVKFFEEICKDVKTARKEVKRLIEIECVFA